MLAITMVMSTNRLVISWKLWIYRHDLVWEMILINIEIRLQSSAIKINLDVQCAYINDTRNNVVTSSIKSVKIDHINLGDFLEENEAMLKKVSQKNLPSKTRLIYKQISTDHNENGDTYFSYYEMLNIYDDRNHFMKISTEFTKDLDIKREEIVTGGNPSVDKKTVLSNDEITNKSHKEWLKEMFRNNSYQLFWA
jgi:hypothetical protein